MYTFQPGFYQNYQPVYQQPIYLDGQQPIQQVIYSNKKLEHINCVIPETEEFGGLYIGDTISTLRPQHVTNNKIEAILCLNAQAARNAHLTRAHFDYKYIDIQDHPDYPIRLHFQSSNQFIDKQIKNKKNVLVQCHAGVSRSATIICAYLIKHKNWIPQQAIHYLKQKRHRAKPNLGFWKQIEEYWNDLNMKKNSEDQINFKTPTKVNANLNSNTQTKNINDCQKKLDKYQQKTTAVKSQKQLQTPKKENNRNQSKDNVRLREREKSNHKSLSKNYIPHIPQPSQSPVRNKDSISLTNLMNRTVPIRPQPQTQPINIQNFNPIYQSPQPVMQSWRTHPSQTMYNPHIQQQQHYQPVHNFYSVNYQNNNGFTRSYGF